MPFGKESTDIGRNYGCCTEPRGPGGEKEANVIYPMWTGGIWWNETSNHHAAGATALGPMFVMGDLRNLKDNRQARFEGGGVDAIAWTKELLNAKRDTEMDVRFCMISRTEQKNAWSMDARWTSVPSTGDAPKIRRRRRCEPGAERFGLKCPDFSRVLCTSKTILWKCMTIWKRVEPSGGEANHSSVWRVTAKVRKKEPYILIDWSRDIVIQAPPAIKSITLKVGSPYPISLAVAGVAAQSYGFGVVPSRNVVNLSVEGHSSKVGTVYRRGTEHNQRVRIASPVDENEEGEYAGEKLKIAREGAPQIAREMSVSNEMKTQLNSLTIASRPETSYYQIAESEGERYEDLQPWSSDE
ncbi:hypothetical protein EV421DRAFT_1741511 [Armillaria borealis]|uniref:Uncharacterized protein n=1 Tax=Armillaria borealis TaxID=47425 RepID=A0AA39J340_9AGAR|nr:hypothetical protein EV421DRAFT_1741511 [Armillaria borealis]